MRQYPPQGHRAQDFRGPAGAGKRPGKEEPTDVCVAHEAGDDTARTLPSPAAEREGFEPSIEREPDTRLAGECLQPLGHLSRHTARLYAQFCRRNRRDRAPAAGGRAAGSAPVPVGAGGGPAARGGRQRGRVAERHPLLRAAGRPRQQIRGGGRRALRSTRRRAREAASSASMGSTRCRSTSRDSRVGAAADRRADAGARLGRRAVPADAGRRGEPAGARARIWAAAPAGVLGGLAGEPGRGRAAGRGRDRRAGGRGRRGPERRTGGVQVARRRAARWRAFRRARSPRSCSAAVLERL